MSFNIRYGETGLSSIFDKDGWKSLQNPRRQRVVDTVRRDMPDVIGMQEVLDFQMNDLRSALPEYETWGVGRDDGQLRGEFEPLFYKRTRFQKIEGGHFWLSQTPEVPGTVFPGSGSVRMASWLRLYDIACDQSVLILNTHLDNVSQSSREQSSLLIQERLTALVGGSQPLVMGDFNATESNAALSHLLLPLSAVPLEDSYRLIHPVQSPDEASFHDFTGRNQGERIDFILFGSAWVVSQAEIRRDSFAGRYPSDHYPVTALLESKF